LFASILWNRETVIVVNCCLQHLVAVTIDVIDCKKQQLRQHQHTAVQRNAHEQPANEGSIFNKNGNQWAMTVEMALASATQ